MTVIKRHYVAIDGRLVHLRWAGQGPALLLLHQSPRSSEELEPLIAALAADFTVIAPDTPGNGLSDPLAQRDPEIEPFADALERLLNRLGIAKCGVYGYHTGAAIGCGLALRHPDRVSFAVLNGLPGFDPDERANILANYLPPFEPRWDGSHLAWAWARLREQTIFFPWYDTRSSARMDFDLPPPAALQQAVLDLLRAGDHYRDAYGAAFRLESPKVARGLRVPTAIVATARDPLRPHLDRISNLPDHISVAEIAPGNEAVRDCLLAMQALHPAPGLPALAATKTSRHYIDLGSSQIHVRQFGSGSGRPLVLVDARYGSGRTLARIADAAAIGRTVFAPCLPGCGESSDSSTLNSGFASIKSLFPEDAEISWIGNSRLDPEQILAPEMGGGHLLSVWQKVRDDHLFAPYVASLRMNIKWGSRPSELALLQEETIAALLVRVAITSPRQVSKKLDPNGWRSHNT